MDEKRKAVALKYKRKVDRAPKIIAKGRGEIAEQIIQIADAHGIPLHEDQGLADVLELLDLDTEIPSELYRAVAEVLVFIYDIDSRMR